MRGGDPDYGIRTLLMTDVVGSTRLWASHSVVMPEVIECLEILAATAVEDAGGQLLKRRGEGDSLFCVLPHSVAAVRAATALFDAIEAEIWPNGIAPKLRAAIHCGLAHGRDEDVFGPVPNRCARLREVGHGGQILLSGAAKGQIPPYDDLVLTDLGRHRLRDLDEPETIWQVGAERFPPLRSLSSLRNNLPIQLTRFIGREALRNDLLERLKDDRLTTLTGAGGSGKTRLSLQLGADTIDSFPDGVWFVELAETATETGVVRAIAESCGHRDLPDAEILPALMERLATRHQTLFILDNAEQAVATIGHVVAAMTAALPNARIVVTSREPLRLRGEQVHRVPPLRVPSQGCTDPAAVAATEAGALFIDRASLRMPDFELRPANAIDLTEIVRRLDGIPLCLEMAAAHVDYLDLHEIASRLSDRFALLEGDDANAPPRHRTMRETIAWQYDTLSEAEKVLLQRLASFAGSFALDAAEAVGGKPPLSPTTVLRHLRTLVDKSLVVATPDETGMRYRLLETIAQFASGQPEGETEAAMPSLMDWSIGFINAGFSGMNGPEQKDWVRRTDANLPTLYRVINWALAENEPRVARPLYELTRYFLFRGYYHDARALFERALGLPVTGLGRADLLDALGIFCNRMGDQGAAETAYRQALQESSLDGAKRARCLCNLAITLNDRGDTGEARRYYGLAIELAEAIDEPRLLHPIRFNLSLLLLDLGSTEEVKHLLDSLKDHYASVGDTTRLALCHEAMANLWIQLGDHVLAARSLAEVWNVGDREVPAQISSDVMIDAAWIAARTGALETASLLLEGHVRVQQDMRSMSAPRKSLIERSVREAISAYGTNGLRQSVAEARAATLEELVRRARDVSYGIFSKS